MNMPIGSRLLQRLDARIAQASSEDEADCLRAERIVFLVRLGHLDIARDDFKALRDRLRSSSNAQYSVGSWIALAEAMLVYFSDLNLGARQHVQRAHSLAVAGRLRPMQALSAAWMAHLDYAQRDFPSMARYLTQALQEAEPDHHGARSRASLVVAQAYHFADRPELAQPWYQRAHDHATAEGDPATLSALIHNRAWLDGNHARVKELFGPEPATDVKRLLMGAQSSSHLDQHLGTAWMTSLMPVLQAQLHLVQGDAAAALALYEDHLEPACKQGLERMRALCLADMAWARTQLGQLEAARADAQRAEAALLADTLDSDDGAAAHGRLAQVHGVFGDTEAQARHTAQAEACLQAYRAQQAEALDALATCLKQVGPIT